MIEFLDADRTLNVARRLVSSGHETVLAVSFWGEGALQRLGFTRENSEKTKIVCDIHSGACNPQALRELIELGIDVRTKNNLHAKVIWTPRGVLVGSSNASANGLGMEGSELAANIEAGLFTDEASVIHTIRDWLASVVLPGEKITPRLIEECRSAWEYRRQHRHPPMRSSHRSGASKQLSNLLASDPTWFSDKPVEVWAFFDSETSQESDRQVDRLRNETGDQSIDNFELYEVAEKQLGKQFLWFAREGEKQIFQDAYVIIDVEPQLTHTDKNGSWYNHYCRSIPNIGGYQLDQNFLRGVATRLPQRRPRGERQLHRPISDFLA